MPFVPDEQKRGFVADEETPQIKIPAAIDKLPTPMLQGRKGFSQSFHEAAPEMSISAWQQYLKSPEHLAGQGIMTPEVMAMKEREAAERRKAIGEFFEHPIDSLRQAGKSVANSQAVRDPAGAIGSMAGGILKSAVYDPTSVFTPMKPGPNVPPQPVAGEGRTLMQKLRGQGIPEARQAAESAAKTELGGAATRLEESGAAKVAEAQNYGDVQARLQRELDAAKSRPRVDYAQQGETIRGAFNDAMSVAKKTRETAAAKAYAAADEAGKTAVVDVKPAVKPLKDVLEKAGHIPEIRNRIGTHIETIEGQAPRSGPPAPIGAGKVTSKMRVPKVERAAQPLSYEQLKNTSRFLRDKASEMKMEGYDSLTTRALLDASSALDAQIAKAVPEYAKASAEYARLSIPMDSLATRIGKAVTETEGGIKADAYSKIAAQDLPNRLFSKKGGVELMVDALSGGKGASAAARAKAQLQVNQMVENWILEDIRGKGLVGKEALGRIQAPGMRPTMSAVPELTDRMAAQFGREAAAQEQLAPLSEAAQSARKAGEVDLQAAARIKRDLAVADAEAALPGKKSQTAAYNAYLSALRTQAANGLIDQAKYKAALQLFDQATTLEEKTAQARRIAMKAAGMAGVGAAASIGATYHSSP